MHPHTSSSRPVGTVVGIWRYPVKSMAGEAMAAADASWHGLLGDRRWAFVRDGVVRSGFPWLTLRERSDLAHYQPTLLEPERPDASPTSVRTPDGRTLDVADPALAAELGPGVRLIKQDRGVFDTFPLSLVTTQTIARLGEDVGMPLDVRRFRPNLLVEAAGGGAFAEDAWVGSVLRIGTLRLRVDKRDGRCAVITIDPETTERSPEVLRAVARDRDGCLGVYGSTVAPGRVAVGDAVHLDGGHRRWRPLARRPAAALKRRLTPRCSGRHPGDLSNVLASGVHQQWLAQQPVRVAPLNSFTVRRH